MSLLTKNVNIVKTKLPNKGAFTIETKPDFPKMHQLHISSGLRGSGKSISTANYLRECKNHYYIDRILLITPTYNSNKLIWDICDIKPEDVYDIEKGVIKKIMNEIEQEKEQWDQFVADLDKYNKYHTKHKYKEFIDDNTLLEFAENNFFEQRPVWKYPKEQPPRIAVILDDCLSTPVMARPTEGLVNLCIRHRHIAKGLGCSIFMLVQTYCGIGGLSRIIRENATSLSLFKINDKDLIAKVYKECDLEIPYEKFLEILHFCHSEKYQFLFIDFSPKEEKYRFRKGYNEIIQI